MGDTSRYAKQAWKQLQNELLQLHTSFTAMSFKDSGSFTRYVTNHPNTHNHMNLQLFDMKVPHYGKLIFGTLFLPENGRLYVEKVYYPLSKLRFSDRLAIDSTVAYSNHYMEQLVDRSGIETLDQIKALITQETDDFLSSGFAQQYGGLNVNTDFIILHRNKVIFAFGEIDEDNVARLIYKSFITENEFKGKNRQVVDYALNNFDTEMCLLATYHIPETITELQRVIEDTIKRIEINPILTPEYQKSIQSLRTKQQLKQLHKYLAAYDPCI